MFVVDKIGESFTVRQLTFILLVVLVCISLTAYKNTLNKYQSPYTLDQGTITVLDPCPFKSDPAFNWCHGSRYKVCKANYPHEKKIEDFAIIINTIAPILDRHRIHWWIDGDTLIGHQLGNKTLPWDYEIEIGVNEKRFRKYYASIMQELHQCHNDEFPIYYVRFSSSNENLRGKFQTKWEPRFWVNIVTWSHDESTDVMKKAGWVEDGQKYSNIPYKYINPTKESELDGIKVNIPNSPRRVLEMRFNETWNTTSAQPPPWYRPDLEWGSEEMKLLQADL